MKKLLMAVMFLVMAVAAQAQTYVWQSMDSSVKDGYWDLTQTYNNQGDAVAKFDVSDNAADKKEGAGSVKIAYTVGAGEGWGGYIVRTTVQPTLPNYINLSTGTEFSFWYKVTKPVVTTQAGTVFMEFKLGDYDADNKRDLWYMEMPVDLADASGTWKQVKVSIARSAFKVGGDKSKEWNLQFGDGDQEIQLDKKYTPDGNIDFEAGDVVDLDYSTKLLESIVKDASVINNQEGKTKLDIKTIHLTVKSAISGEIAQKAKELIPNPIPIAGTYVAGNGWI